jgi:hypothetical protein
LGAATTAAGIALFVWLLKDADPNELLRGIRQVGWGLIAIIALGGLRFAARAAAWTLCLDAPHRLRITDAFMAVVSGDALGNATPLGPLVGEPAKVAFVRKRVPLGAAFTALAVENIFYTLSVAAMIAAGTIALLLRGGIAGNMRLAAEVAIAVVFAAYAGVAWTLWRKPAVLSRVATVIGRVWPSPRLEGKLEKIRHLEQDLYTFASRRRRAVVPLILIELLFHALGVLEVHLTLWLALGAPDHAPPLIHAFILETANRFISVAFKFVPMQQPGLNESSTVLMAHLLGYGTQVGSTLAIVRRIRMLFWQLAGTALLVRHGVTTRRILDDAELSASG